MELNTKQRSKYSNLRKGVFLITFSLLITVIVVGMAITFAALRLSSQASQREMATTLSDATWAIDSVNPSGKGDGTNTVTLVSSIGNIRRYTGIRSYGLSNDGTTLAASTDSNLRFVDLATDSAEEVILPFAYSGDMGEAISWSPDDENIVLIVTNETDGGYSVLLILDREGNIVTEVQDSFAYYSVDGLRSYFPAKFSPTNKLILIRAFDDEGNPVERDPVTLKVFNVAGAERKSILVREAVPTVDQVTYFWDRAGNTVLYSADPIGTSVNYAKEPGFSQAFVGF